MGRAGGTSALSRWGRWGSNPRPRDYESLALTTELQPRRVSSRAHPDAGGPCRLEPGHAPSAVPVTDPALFTAHGPFRSRRCSAPRPGWPSAARAPGGRRRGRCAHNTSSATRSHSQRHSQRQRQPGPRRRPGVAAGPTTGFAPITHSDDQDADDVGTAYAGGCSSAKHSSGPATTRTCRPDGRCPRLHSELTTVTRSAGPARSGRLPLRSGRASGGGAQGPETGAPPVVTAPPVPTRAASGCRTARSSSGPPCARSLGRRAK